MKARRVDSSPAEIVQQRAGHDGDGVEARKRTILEPLVECYLHRAARSAVGGRDRRQAKPACDSGEEDVGAEPVGVDDVGCETLEHATNGSAFSEVRPGCNDDALHAHIGPAQAVGERIVGVVPTDTDDVNSVPRATLHDGEPLDHTFQPTVFARLERVDDGQWGVSAGRERWRVGVVGIDDGSCEWRHGRAVGNRYAVWDILPKRVRTTT